ncbi:putative DNA-binding protein (MmcQ/YjbR family) [Marmoricola sp. OAE513]|uniref:MmcQ/YjbR family DNA-binding protein n=1 Tax=Marmoricola sp. OAE513 TaxID=2817894 RepID=UPI001AE13C77
MTDLELDAATVARLGDLCLTLPGVVEENAWHGVRWRVRGRTFAHVLTLVDGRPASYAEAAGIDGPAVVLTFRVTEEDRELLLRLGHPHFAARWGRDLGGLILAGAGSSPDGVDWSEVAELLTDSWRLMAPQKLVSQLSAGGAG